MDEIYTISLLLDFYGQLITKRQFDILDLHYNSDYSLGEIAAELNISRQGVYDNIKRGKAALYDMEEKLGLVSRFGKQKERASGIMKLLEEIDSSRLSESDQKTLETAKNEIRSIVED
ncbi:MAG TPA: YlxM family DNA-binding protein [Clostridia bacterium]|nr:YlxM family DNA-binding protein [Clostridia bacterium]